MDPGPPSPSPLRPFVVARATWDTAPYLAAPDLQEREDPTVGKGRGPGRSGAPRYLPTYYPS